MTLESPAVDPNKSSSCGGLDKVDRQVPGFSRLIHGEGFSDEQLTQFSKAKKALTPKNLPSPEKVARAMEIIEASNDKPGSLGPRTLEDDFTLDESQVEDDGGEKRRSAKPLKTLSPRQKTVVLLHLQGIKSSEISRQTGYSISWVSTILSDPLVVPIIEEYHDLAKKEIVGLSSEAVDVQRNALRSKDEKLRLKASETVLKAAGLLDDDKQADSSVRGLMEEALNRISARSSQTTVRAIKERTLLEVTED